MEIRLTQLSGTALNEALSKDYLLPDEDEFILNASDSYEEYKNITRWIQTKNELNNWCCCGMIVYGPDVDENFRDCYWVQRLMICPAYRRYGIAFEALKMVLKETPKEFKIYTSIVDGNIKSENLFRKSGFIKTHRFYEGERMWQLSG